MQGASVQCMHATEMERSPGNPSFTVTRRLRFTPQGTSFTFLHAVVQPLHSMQLSASQMNFILAMVVSRCSSGALDVAERRLGFLHHGDRVVAVRRGGVYRLAAHERRRTFRILPEQVLALPPPGEVKRDESRSRTHALGDERPHLELRSGGGLQPHPGPVLDSPIACGLGGDLDAV